MNILTLPGSGVDSGERPTRGVTAGLTVGVAYTADIQAQVSSHQIDLGVRVSKTGLAVGGVACTVPARQSYESQHH